MTISGENSSLEDQARRLAARHKHASMAVQRGSREIPLIAFLDEYEALFEQSIRHFRGASEAELAVSYAAEWMLDNPFILDQALREIRKDLPARYYRQLPKLTEGELAELPRVYGLARDLIVAEHAHLDMERVHNYIQAYQSVTPLTMGELWALPTMLRLGILQCLALSVSRIAGVPLPKNQAPSLFIDLIPEISDDEVVANSFLSLRMLAAEEWKEFFETASLVELILRRDPADIYARMDFETRDRYRKSVEELALDSGMDEGMVAREAVRLAQEASDLDHRNTAEAMRAAHVGYYLLDAGRIGLETNLGFRPGPGLRLKRTIFAHQTLVYLGSIAALTFVFILALGWYAAIGLGSGGTIWSWIVAVALSLVPAVTVSVNLVNWVVTLVIKPKPLPKMDYGSSQPDVAGGSARGRLPLGIPEEHAALVVVPALLDSVEELDALVKQIELHYLRNPDPNLSFALLTDFADALQPHVPGDEELLEDAQRRIRSLNERFRRESGVPFYLFHRPRKWNPSEERWMGWERKRGKLHELNQRILGARVETGLSSSSSHARTRRAKSKRQPGENMRTPSFAPGKSGEQAFIIEPGEAGQLAKFRYVITLDADTILPRESGARLVATLAHPLNRPVFGPGGKVVAGYSILQPRTEISPTSANQSLFTQIFSGESGLDLYTRAVSDVYQDLLGEGIYVGKGIYDVEAFERSLEGQMPENVLLSHDLFEGILARAALATDIVLIEDYPPNYLAHTRRMRRWIRGDWQLLPWLFPRVPSAQGGKQPNRLSAIDRWKILDNLRRSLVPPAVFALLVASWLGILPGSDWAWTLTGLFTLAAPLFTGPITALIHSLKGSPLQGVQTSISDNLQRWLLALAFLPYEAILSSEAIVTTLVRLYITRKHLLRWTTSAQSALKFGNGSSSKGSWSQMIPTLGLVLILAAGVGLRGSQDLQALFAASPLLIAWLLSPEIAYLVSRPILHRPEPLNAAQRQSLRNLARRTWLFFEQYIGPEDHWLPPDHFQESPLGIVAHRTSPTNLGLALASTLAAYDLGYLGLLDLAARLRLTFETMEKLERYRGHFLNWYDTRSLEPLPPRYVSSVDSGNLAASLIALKQGCFELLEAPILCRETMQGLLDALALLAELLRPERAEPRLRAGVSVVTWPEMEALCARVDAVSEQIQRLQAMPGEGTNASLGPMAWAAWLYRFAGQAGKPGGTRMAGAGDEIPAASLESLEEGLLALVEARGEDMDVEKLHRLRIFARRVRLHVGNALREMDFLLPWIRLLANPPSLLLQPELAPAFQDAWQDAFQDAWKSLQESLPAGLRLCELDAACKLGQEKLGWLREMVENAASLREDGHIYPEGLWQEAQNWCAQMEESLRSANMAAKVLQIGLREIGQQAEKYAAEMDFRFLFDEKRQVFHIGYNVASGRLDDNYYDLLASESRIASLVAIAKGDIPQTHWLHLGRPLTRVDGTKTLLSWSATMFEYLMPLLFVRNYEGTLLHLSTEAAAAYQMIYGEKKRVPWGISESGYYRFDANQFYQYRAFGVPGLGFKRGLGEDLVITPYASLLALTLRPPDVLKNIAALADLGMLGRYGFYEAVDFTSSRLPLGCKYEIVRSYMAHHQAMIFLSIGNLIGGEPMVRRFHSAPQIQSAELLLQELIPKDAPLEFPHGEDGRATRPAQAKAAAIPWRARLQTAQPRVHLLSNGRYSVLVNSAGGGYSSWNETDLTRWRADTTLNNWGTWIYVKDLDSGALWSAAHQPTAVRPQSRDVYFNAHLAEFRRRDNEISLVMEMVVPPEEDVEVRKITLTNHSSRRRRLFLSSYGEVILAPQASDQRHPAFNKLFIESEWAPDVNALLFRRRPRSEKEQPVYLAHLLVVEQGIPARLAGHGEPGTSRTYESDRMRFLGRGRTPRAPAALLQPGQAGRGKPVPGQIHFSDTVGSTLDPVFAIGQEVTLEPHGTLEVAYLSLAAGSREQALALASRYQAWHVINQAFEQARERAEVELVQLGLNTAQLERIQSLLSLLIYPHAALRPEPETLAQNRMGQTGLWKFSISGDYPILLVRLYGQEDLALAREAIQAHIYWRNRQMKVDLVFLNEQGTNYGQELAGLISRLIAGMQSEAWFNRRGGIFILLADQLSPEERALLETAARVVLDGKKGVLAEQIGPPNSPADIGRLATRLPEFVPSPTDRKDPEPTPVLPRPADLRFYNGLGGFSPDGREYIVYLEPGQWTPAPWINVIANPEFGFLVSETGSGYTWSINSGENRLTPWSNDPVSDPAVEALYLRDEETAQVWSPTPLPARASAPYLVRHGAGYSIFEHSSHGLRQQVRVFAAPGDPVKVVQLRLENLWSRARRITATYYVEWVLGVSRENSQQYVIPEFDGVSQALMARNPYNLEFGERVAFLAASKPLHGLTADRTEFLGRAGGRARPAAMRRIGLAGTVRAGLDPCGALQLHIDLQPGAAEEVYFLIGQGSRREEAIRLAQQYQAPEQVEAAWQAVHALWDEVLGAVCVQTPEPAMDLLLNRWLLYQALSCRIWGRSALYQSSGAYGFRDQLQDVLALILARPEITREHLLRSAGHQFEAGDVLHWWHPPSGRGVRTRFSDDLLWLPFAVANYVEATGDEGVLDEQVPYRKGPPLEPQEDERYAHYPVTGGSEDGARIAAGREPGAYTLFEHCRRAVERGTTSGPHKLPLMGTGDWNDGMNRVGAGGKGESIWLGWFLYDTLTRFAGICERRGEARQAEVYRQRAQELAGALEESAWDGAWYLRSFYDDGTPLGSAQNRECQIDSIAQSWAVLSGAGNPQWNDQAMQSVSERLVKKEDGMILLFTPPFDKTQRDPGYIKGYVPGIRENGGQYTHAALWAVWAFAELGQGDYAEELFRMLNPIYLSDTPAKAARYKVEPYVVAADVYSVPPHTGRGGWTWYTGSAGWMYRLGVEAILGLRRQGQALVVDPCIPKAWKEYRIDYRTGRTCYRIQVENPQGVQRGVKEVSLDGEILKDGRIPIGEDGREHEVRVILGD